EAMIRAYERIAAPKRLLVGAWTHTMPDASLFAPVDFATVALPWWDRWLKGTDNGIDAEPPVVLHRQGSTEIWRQYDSWPPSKTVQCFATGASGTRMPPVPPE